MTARTFTEAQVERGLLEMGRLAYADAVDRANGIGPMEPLHDTATRILSGMEAVEPHEVNHEAVMGIWDRTSGRALSEYARKWCDEYGTPGDRDVEEVVPEEVAAHRADFERPLRALSLPATREVPGEANEKSRKR